MWSKLTLTIPKDQSRSQVLLLILERNWRYETDILFYVPADITESLSLYVAPEAIDDGYDPAYLPLQKDGRNIMLPAGRATRVESILAGGLVLVTGGNAQRDRVITLCMLTHEK
jgi:hypothetical protein